MNTMLAIAGVEILAIGFCLVLCFRRSRRDERDKRRLAKWLTERENRLSRERFWQ